MQHVLCTPHIEVGMGASTSYWLLLLHCNCRLTSTESRWLQVLTPDDEGSTSSPVPELCTIGKRSGQPQVSMGTMNLLILLTPLGP
jgi:hypothetical protein